VQVLERLKLSGYTGLSLSNRARQVADNAAAAGARP
jgi:hypothetical protein